mmetsp:Transcript_5491/g.8576  ORF Transcript_5491/g.8576 Transcript_5491/m.8576 type:complete len:128 (-) Transcript_5491:21-404(-)
MLGKDVVEDALKTLFLAIQDLIKYDKNINLAFGFCNVRITNRNLKVHFHESLNKTVGSSTFENQMVRQKSPVSTLWKTSYNEQWAKSTLGSLVKKPNMQVTRTLNEKTEALRVMSLDLSSAGRFFKA